MSLNSFLVNSVVVSILMIICTIHCSEVEQLGHEISFSSAEWQSRYTLEKEQSEEIADTHFTRTEIISVKPTATGSETTREIYNFPSETIKYSIKQTNKNKNEENKFDHNIKTLICHPNIALVKNFVMLYARKRSDQIANDIMESNYPSENGIKYINSMRTIKKRQPREFDALRTALLGGSASVLASPFVVDKTITTTTRWVNSEPPVTTTEIVYGDINRTALTICVACASAATLGLGFYLYNRWRGHHETKPFHDQQKLCDERVVQSGATPAEQITIARGGIAYLTDQEPWVRSEGNIFFTSPFLSRATRTKNFERMIADIKSHNPTVQDL